MLGLIRAPQKVQSVRNAYTHTNPGVNTDVNRDVSLDAPVPRLDRYLIQVPRGRGCLGAGSYMIAFVKRAYWLNEQTVRVVMCHLTSAGDDYAYDLPVDVLGPFRRVQYVTVTTDFTGIASQRITKTAAISPVDVNKALVVPVIQSGVIPYMHYATADFFFMEKLWLSANDQVSAQFRLRSANYLNQTIDLAVVEL
jgi:hypothetical protein